MTTIVDNTPIHGVQLVELNAFGDARGSFREIFRREWFPQRTWTSLQSNCSRSKEGVLRGLHFHFHQVDYWFVPEGVIRAALVDIRPHSPTYRTAWTVDMGSGRELGLYIPVGVAHGFATLADATLLYFVDNYYDGSDEHGIAWDDASLRIDWGLQTPIVSARDRANAPLDALSAELRERLAHVTL